MMTYTRHRICVHCREPFSVDPKRPTARICIPCATNHPDRRVRDRLTTPPKTNAPIQRGPHEPILTATRRLIAPPGEWVSRAACTPKVAEMFWPLPGQSGGPVVEAALQLCSHCPVVRDCGQWALDNGQTEGIWGGMRPGALRRLVEKRRAEQPAPQPVAAPQIRLRSCANCPKQFEPMPEWPNGRLCPGCRSVHNDPRSRIPAMRRRALTS